MPRRTRRTRRTHRVQFKSKNIPLCPPCPPCSPWRALSWGIMRRLTFQPKRLEVEVALDAAQDGVADHVAVAQVDDRPPLDLQRFAPQPGPAAGGAAAGGPLLR